KIRRHRGHALRCGHGGGDLLGAAGQPVVLGIRHRGACARARLEGSNPDPTRIGMLGSTKIALVHDYLVVKGGAERVLLSLARLYPEAPIFTAIYRPTTTFAEFGG